MFAPPNPNRLGTTPLQFLPGPNSHSRPTYRLARLLRHVPCSRPGVIRLNAASKFVPRARRGTQNLPAKRQSLNSNTASNPPLSG